MLPPWQFVVFMLALSPFAAFLIYALYVIKRAQMEAQAAYRQCLINFALSAHERVKAQEAQEAAASAGRG